MYRLRKRLSLYVFEKNTGALAFNLTEGARYGRECSMVYEDREGDMPIKCNRKGEYKLQLDVRCCDFAWILDSLEQCVEYNVPIRFERTGAGFNKRNNVYLIDWKDQTNQAQKARGNYRY